MPDLTTSLKLLGVRKITVATAADSINVTLNCAMNSMNVIEGTTAFNITALIKLITDLLADLPVIIADFQAVFSSTKGATAPLFIPGLRVLTFAPAADNTINISVNFVTGSVEFGSLTAFNVTALIKLLTDLSADIPVIIADVTAVFGATPAAPTR